MIETHHSEFRERLEATNQFGILRQWDAINDATKAVALAARQVPFPGMKDTEDEAILSALLGGAAPWQLALAENSIKDLAAIIEPGLTALLAAQASGRDARAAASALLREIDAARSALVALLAPFTPSGQD